jgi:DNA-binding transcriptional LysR family regulator
MSDQFVSRSEVTTCPSTMRYGCRTTRTRACHRLHRARATSRSGRTNGIGVLLQSKIVSRLEDRLGVKLLQRTTRRLVLSQEGETYSIRGREILAAIEAAVAEVTAGRGQPRGHIRINTGTAFAKHRLAPLLPEFQKRYPDITVEISVIDRRVDVVAEQIDVAIRVGPLHDTSLVSHRLGEVRRIIAASPAYLRRHGRPRHARDLLSHNCLHLRGFSRLAGWPMYVDG